MPAPSPPDDVPERDGPATPSPPAGRTLAPSPDGVGIGPRAARGEPLSEARQHLASDPRHIRLAMYLAWRVTQESPWLFDEAESHSLLLLVHAARLYPEDATVKFSTYLYRYLPRQLRRFLGRWPKYVDVDGPFRWGLDCMRWVPDWKTPSADLVSEWGGLACDGRPGVGLRSARKRAGLTVVQLAQRMGCSHPQIVGYENGRARPRLETVEAMARELGCGLGEVDSRFSGMAEMIRDGAA